VTWLEDITDYTAKMLQQVRNNNRSKDCSCLDFFFDLSLIHLIHFTVKRVPDVSFMRRMVFNRISLLNQLISRLIDLSLANK